MRFYKLNRAYEFSINNNHHPLRPDTNTMKDLVSENIESLSDHVPVSVDIFGCCYTRDIFNEYLDGPYKIQSYIFGLHPFLINNNRPEFSRITESDLLELAGKTTDFRVKEYLSHKFLRRNLLYSFNGFSRKNLEDKHAQWLVIASFYDSCPLMKVTDCNSGEVLYLQNDVAHIVESICKHMGFGFEIIDGFLNRPREIDDFCEWINEVYGENVILVFGEPSEYRSPDHVYFQYIEPSFNILNQITFCREIVKRIPVHYVDIPFPKVSRDRVSVVHYEQYVFDYLREVILNITKGIGNKNEIQLRYKQIAFEIMNGRLPLIRNILDKGQKIIDEKRPLETIFELTDKVIDDYRVQDLIGRAYLNQSPPRLECALTWFRRSFESGKMSPGNICRTLDMMGTDDAYSEKIRVIRSAIEMGFPSAYGLMGRAYRDGKGVPSDLRIAATWMRKATEWKIGWANWELFDILWRIGTPESYKEMIELAIPLAESGNREMQTRMGRAYRDGKGVEKDLLKSKEWYEKAYRQNLIGAGIELSDVLLKINTADSLKTMIEIIVPEAEKNNMPAIMRLGRAYRDGKGVPVDYTRAKELLSKAAHFNPSWAAELKILESKINGEN